MIVDEIKSVLEKDGYDTNPEIIFSKKLYGKIFNENEVSSLIFNDFELVNNENSFYYDTFIGIDNEQIKITDNFEKISDPIIIYPNTNPFKNYTILKYNNPQIKKGGIYQYNQKNEKWIFKERLNNNGYAEVKIYSGGIFCILNESTNPIIKNIFPNNNSYYNTNDLKTISFNIIDSQSKIDYNSISILLNNKPIYFDYIPYRDYVRATLFNSLDKGENILKIFTNDNIGNKSDNEIIFFIK